MLAREDEFEFSRAYEKIKAFDRAVKLRSFFEGKKVLDVGSSTGGFTKFALEKGAREVLAVELGTKQMEPVLALDKRVKLNEKTDIFEVGRSEKSNSGFKLSDEISDVNMVVMDVSFVSARRVLNHLKNNVLNKGVEIVLLLKPQFEVGEGSLVNGIVKNSKMRREIIRAFEVRLRESGFVVLAKRDSEVAGSKGNVERFYLLRLR
jgi:23S rRNA (cytidine1920-2'-O)/16S rRNA (cytidine1409-2'-O)-methyltransferase